MEVAKEQSKRRNCWLVSALFSAAIDIAKRMKVPRREIPPSGLADRLRYTAGFC